MPLFVEIILLTNKIVLFQVSGVEVRMSMQWGHLEDRPLQVRWVEMRMVAMVVKIRQVVKEDVENNYEVEMCTASTLSYILYKKLRIIKDKLGLSCAKLSAA